MRLRHFVSAAFTFALNFTSIAFGAEKFEPNLSGPVDGLRVTTAVSEGERDFYSFKTLTDVTQSTYTVAYDNSSPKNPNDGPYLGALIYERNLEEGSSFFPSFSHSLPKERKNSTALALPKNVLSALKNGRSVEIDQGTGSYYSSGKISFVKFGETKLIWDDQPKIVPTVLAEYRGTAKSWNHVPMGEILVSMEVLDDQAFPVRLHAEAKISGENGTHYTVQTVSDETGRDLEERFGSTLDKGESYTSYDLSFDYDSDEVLPRMDRALEAISKYLEDNPETKIVIIGHTDSRGTESYNNDLSERRAAAIADTLSGRFGHDQARFTTRGLGETEPIATNESLLGRSYNRRVEFRPAI